MAKKRKYDIKSFESSKKSDSYATLYGNMLFSQAYKDLSYRQRNLYVYMKYQYYSGNKPTKEHNEHFYFNKGMFMSDERYSLYTNEKQFRIDRDALIDKGFIKCVYDGSIHKKKSIYAYSDKWQKYGTPGFNIPNQDKTLSLIHKEQFIKMVNEGRPKDEICAKFKLSEQAYINRLKEYNIG